MKAKIVKYNDIEFLISQWWKAEEEQFIMKIDLLDNDVNQGCVSMTIELGNDVIEPVNETFDKYVASKSYETDFCDAMIAGAKMTGIIK